MLEMPVPLSPNMSSRYTDLFSVQPLKRTNSHISRCVKPWAPAIMIAPHQTVKIPTGLSMELPENTFGGIYARSGIATKEGLAPANKVGVIDSDYRGEIMVSLHNHSDEYRIVEPGQRIAQLIIQPYVRAKFTETKTLNDTDRGSGGFGSTGK